MSEMPVPGNNPDKQIDIGAIARDQEKASGVKPETYQTIPPAAEEMEIDIGEVAKRQETGFEPMNMPAKPPMSPEEKEALAQKLKAEGQMGMREALGQLETPANVQQQAAEQLKKMNGNETVN